MEDCKPTGFEQVLVLFGSREITYFFQQWKYAI